MSSIERMRRRTSTLVPQFLILRPINREAAMSKFNVRISRPALALAGALIVAGCAVTQPIPPRYDLPPGSATTAQNEALRQYWTLFNDPVLDQLVEEALANIEDAIRGYLDLYGEPETRCEIREMEVVTA